MHLRFQKICAILLVLAIFVPELSRAETTFEVTGWVPYWRTDLGVADASAHLDEFTEINPFVYTVKTDGTLVDNGSLSDDPWKTLIATAQEKKIRVIPSIMWSNPDAIHKILSSTKARIALEDRITALVKENNFDGIDIDFEGKKAATKNYFSTFLKGLYQRIGSKWVMCTIEARTPLSDRYFGTTIPADASLYANDFQAINRYCDRVRFMTYDQQGIDLKLASDAQLSGEVYAPVADPKWVEKVISLAAKDIPKRKILLGIPTYGYEYDVTAYANNQYIYDILWTFNPGYALSIASGLGITPERNSAGELFFTYVPQNASSTGPVLSGISALAAAAAASTYATSYNSHLNFRLADWPDAESIRQKIALAKQLGVRGVSIFKIDGGEDPNIWSVLSGVKQ